MTVTTKVTQPDLVRLMLDFVVVSAPSIPGELHALTSDVPEFEHIEHLCNILTARIHGLRQAAALSHHTLTEMHWNSLGVETGALGLALAQRGIIEVPT